MIEEVEPGDVIQINPDHSEMWGGCLAIVEKVQSWGVQCAFPIPDKGAVAFNRIEFGDFVVIGPAKWLGGANDG